MQMSKNVVNLQGRVNVNIKTTIQNCYEPIFEHRKLFK